MRRYETIFIADPDLQDDVRADLFDKFKNLIEQEKGIIVSLDDWGNRKLAYEIRKKARGHYVCLTYGGTGALVNELERNFRLDDKVLKFMTILLDKDVDPDALAQEIEAEAVARSAQAENAREEETEVDDEENDELAETDDDTEEDD